MYGIKRKKLKKSYRASKKNKGEKEMARMRRSSKQTLEYKIEQAEAKVAKTREAHEKAVDELKKMYDMQYLHSKSGM